MKLILLSAILMLTINTNAQTGSWIIKLNNKEIITTSVEDENKNCKKLKNADWKKTGNLEISFTENEPDAWFRSFIFYDEDQNELFRADSINSLSISLEKLRKLYSGKKALKIYTAIAPRNPAMAVRIRIVHLYLFMLP